MAEYMKRMSCSPHFSTPGHPQACGLVERYVGTIISMVSKSKAMVALLTLCVMGTSGSSDVNKD